MAAIFEPLRPGMTTPEVVQCPDGRLRRAIFQIGPIIADYPEQVMLAGIIGGWCPKYVLNDLSYPWLTSTIADVSLFPRRLIVKGLRGLQGL